MIITPFKNPFSARRSSSVFKLPNALHEWNYQNATDVGTTITMPDTGTIGGLPMANPDAASKPTLGVDGVEFDGIIQYLMNTVANFRGADATGVLHCLISIPTGDSTLSFCSSDNATTTEYLIFDSSPTNKARILTRIGATIRSLETTATYSGFKLLTSVQDGTQAYILIDGVEIVSYSTSTLTTEWFNGFTNRDNISFGGLISSSPVFKPSKLKYCAYSPYVSKAAAISDANLILNGL